jgi:hypothetical protein
MASRRCIIVADAYLTGFKRGSIGKPAMPDDECYMLARYLMDAGYQVTQVEAAQIIKDHLRRGTLLV